MTRRALALGLLAAAAAAAPAHAAIDPAERALRRGDTYVSPLARDVVSADDVALLARRAARMIADGRPVKLAIVAGPRGAPSMRRYVLRLGEALDARRVTVVVTAPDRPVAAVGPRAPADVTKAFRSAHVNRLHDPVARVLKAADLAAPPPPGEAGSAVTGVGVLLGLGLAGGVWAAAWGLRRERRHARLALDEARAHASLRLDALRARSDAVGRRTSLPPAARALLEGSAATRERVAEAVAAATDAGGIEAAMAELGPAEVAAARAAALTGLAVDPEDPFDGLCAVDPAHGEATEVARPADAAEPAPVCADCARACASADPPRRRTVPVGGRPVPFDVAR
jgi:hypothetical protein